MIGLRYILQNNSAVVSLVGSENIFYSEAPQSIKLPFIIVDEEDIEPHDSMTGASTLDRVHARVIVYASRTNTNGNVIGSRNIADAVRSALDDINENTYGGEVIADIRFTDQRSDREDVTNETRKVVYQTYEVWVRRDGTSRDEMISLAYSNSNQTITDGDPIAAMSSTLNPSGATGAYSVFSGSLDGLTLNSSTGAITGTPSGAQTIAATIQFTGSGAYYGNVYATVKVVVVEEAFITVTDLSFTNNGQSVNTSQTPATLVGSTTPSAATGVLTLAGGAPAQAQVSGKNITFSGPVAAGVHTFVAMFTPNGDYSGVVTEEITLTVTIPVAALTYNNTGQTIWEAVADAQGKGAFINMLPVLVSGETVSYSIPTPYTGVSINGTTGEISITFASLVLEANTFTIRKTGTGLYSGTADLSVTITKKDIWPLQSSTATILRAYNLGLNVTSSGGAISAIARWVAAADNINLTCAVADFQPRVSTLRNGEPCANFVGDSKLQLNASITAPLAPVRIFCLGEIPFPSTQTFIANFGNDNANLRAGTEDFTIESSGPGSPPFTAALPDTLKNTLQGRAWFFELKIKNSEGHTFKVNGTQTSSISFTFSNENLSVLLNGGGFFGPSATGTAGTGVGKIKAFIVLTGAHPTAGELEKIEGLLAYLGSCSDLLPVSHAYYNSPYPPFTT